MKIANCKWREGTRMSLAFIWIVPMALILEAAESNPPTPLAQAHAHNDYEHARPLLDALDHGFCSVEADVWLVNGQLLVAHDLKDVKRERTLRALYIEPLRARVARNGGKVFRDGPPFTLLVDVKSDATNTYAAIREVLKPYEGMLTRFSPAHASTGAVTVVISGNRARALMAAETNRLAAYDGRLADLDSSDSRHLIPLVSDNWTQHFKWRARADEGLLSEAESAKLKQLVERAHQQGRRLRFWATADNPAMWAALRDAGVDYINTDDLAGLEKFLLEQRRPK
jgi:glycerophosphoryl diester phosphodiesterase